MYTIDKSTFRLTLIYSVVKSQQGWSFFFRGGRHYGTIQREQKPALKLSSAFHQMLVFQTIRGEQP